MRRRVGRGVDKADGAGKTKLASKDTNLLSPSHALAYLHNSKGDLRIRVVGLRFLD
jgi:hypothetical protein